jgi:hypothetical protein
LIDVPTTVLVVVDGADVVVVVGVVVVVAAGAVVVVVAARAGAVVVVVAARAGGVDVVVVVVFPALGDPLLVEALDARVVVVAPRELSDKVAGLLWKLISAANPATVATATIPARLMVEVLSLWAYVFDSSRH